MPNSLHALKTRIAISPRFATSTERMGLYSTWNCEKQIAEWTWYFRCVISEYSHVMNICSWKCWRHESLECFSVHGDRCQRCTSTWWWMFELVTRRRWVRIRKEKFCWDCGNIKLIIEKSAKVEWAQQKIAAKPPNEQLMCCCCQFVNQLLLNVTVALKLRVTALNLTGDETEKSSQAKKTTR